MRKSEIRNFILETKNALKNCEPSHHFATNLAKTLNADYAILLGMYTRKITILNLNDQGSTSDGEEWVKGALGNMRISKLPIYLVQKSHFEQAKFLVSYACNSDMFPKINAGKHLYKFLRDISKMYVY